MDLLPLVVGRPSLRATKLACSRASSRSFSRFALGTGQQFSLHRCAIRMMPAWMRLKLSAMGSGVTLDLTPALRVERCIWRSMPWPDASRRSGGRSCGASDELCWFVTDELVIELDSDIADLIREMTDVDGELGRLSRCWGWGSRGGRPCR